MTPRLGQVEVRAAALSEKPPGVVKEVKAEVEEAARNGLAVDLNLFLVQMPAARPHKQGRDLVVESVFLALGAGEIDPPLDGVDQVDLPFHEVRTGGRVRVLEIRHEHAGTRVERVDQHLAVGWAGDLHAPVLQVLRSRGDLPLRLANRFGISKELR